MLDSMTLQVLAVFADILSRHAVEELSQSTVVHSTATSLLTGYT